MPIIDLIGGARIVLEAVSPTTGATVAGVTFADGVIYGDDRSGESGDAPIDSMYLLPTGD